MDGNLILLATDGSAHAAKAAELASEIALARNADLLVLHVQRRHGGESIPEGLEEYARLENVHETEASLFRSAALRIVEDAAMAARERGVGRVEAEVAEGSPAAEIVRVARLRDAGMIVMGSRGLGGIEGLVLGSVSHKVAHAAPCTCILVR